MNDINELRTVLFATLKGLTDKEAPMDIERAKAVCEVGQTIINSAKVEVEHMRIAGGRGTGFLGEIEQPPAPDGQTGQTATGMKTITAIPGGTVTRHRMR